ncbi:50S ribosomal protein L37ae [Candidatus Woesearchaeota archaeon]|nr:50S ribosomal protein L37ae [Candidatus Woesearchaeota archaeon]
MTEIKRKKGGSAKRFGARYGRTTRTKISELERAMRSRQKCPYCMKNKVKRVASGIWHCKGCNAKFAGAAYIIKRETKSGVAE